MNRVRGIVLLAFGMALAAAGCVRPHERREPELTWDILGESQALRRVVGWRLVERSSDEVDPRFSAAGDGRVAAESRVLLFEPVFDDPAPEAFGERSESPGPERASRLELRLLGARTYSIGEPATLEGRIEGSPGILYEMVLGPTRAGIEILEVRGAERMVGRAGRYRVPGGRAFEVVFTSRITGPGAVGAWVLRGGELEGAAAPPIPPLSLPRSDSSPGPRKSSP